MSSPNDEQLDILLEQIPLLAGRPRLTEDLSGGLTNRNVKITVDGATYVARCTGATSALLEIDRGQEFYNSTAAQRAGVGAPVIDYRPDLGILLIGYIDGTTLTNADFQRPGVIARAAASCRKLHSGPRFRGRFDMFERQAGYLRVLHDNGFRLPADYLRYADRFGDIQKALAATDRTTVPCNNDLLAGNFVDDGNKLWLIDYEYAGNNDPCFELGNIWSECGLSSDQLAELVSAYFGKPLRHKIARARLQGAVAKYGWTLWGCIQSASSPIDYDFWGWGMERFDGAVAEFTGPEFARLLDDVQAAD